VELLGDAMYRLGNIGEWAMDTLAIADSGTMTDRLREQEQSLAQQLRSAQRSQDRGWLERVFGTARPDATDAEIAELEAALSVVRGSLAGGEGLTQADRQRMADAGAAMAPDPWMRGYGVTGGATTAPGLAPVPTKTAGTKKYGGQIATGGRSATSGAWAVDELGSSASFGTAGAFERLQNEIQAQNEAEQAMAQERRDWVEKQLMDEVELRKALLDEQVEQMRAYAGEDAALQDQITDYRAKKLKEFQDLQSQSNEWTLKATESMISGLSDIYSSLTEIAGEESSAAFAAYKALATAEAVISTYKGVTLALGDETLGSTYARIAVAAVIGAQGLAQVAVIQSQEPSKYSQYGDGGVSWGPEMALVGEKGPEAHVPLKGGSIPVEISGGGGNTVYISMAGATFLDRGQMRAEMAGVAAQVAAQVAPGAVVRSYDDDGAIRDRVRSGR
jgi:hypothetical protein